MKLSEELEKWRADRPDEWKMDEFIRKAAELELQVDSMTAKINKVKRDAFIAGAECLSELVSEGVATDTYKGRVIEYVQQSGRYDRGNRS